MVTNTLSFYVVLLLLLVVVVIEVQPLPFIIILIIIMVLYNNHYCCFCCCYYFKFTFIYRLHLMPVVYHFLCFITTLKCIWNLLIWVNYTVKFYKHFRRLHSYILLRDLKNVDTCRKTDDNSNRISVSHWTCRHCTVYRFSWISGHSSKTSLCCHQAGLHLPATEGQPHGDPQQGGRDREASPQH